MNLNELFTDTPIDEKQIWAKSGQKVVRKYRCTSGARKGRIVAKPGNCFAAPNIKARFNMKRTRARVGKKMVRGVTTTVDTDQVDIDTDDKGDIEIKNKDASKPNNKRQLRPGASVKFNNENK